jgi:hypothetical protein
MPVVMVVDMAAARHGRRRRRDIGEREALDARRQPDPRSSLHVEGLKREGVVRSPDEGRTAAADAELGGDAWTDVRARQDR